MVRNRIKTLRELNNADLKDKLDDLKVDLVNWNQRAQKEH